MIRWLPALGLCVLACSSEPAPDTSPHPIAIVAGQSNANGVEINVGFPVYKAWLGGASIQQWISSGTPEAWPALEKLLREHGPGSECHIPWIQGETDAEADPSTGDAYAATLRTVLGQIRAPDLCGPTARAYVLALNPGAPLPARGIASVRAAQKLVAADPGNTYVETSQISIPGMHYDSAGLLELDRLIEAAILK